MHPSLTQMLLIGGFGFLILVIIRRLRGPRK